eukprot:6191190-Pleurochrysis_carterae.AAC.1
MKGLDSSRPTLNFTLKFKVSHRHGNSTWKIHIEIRGCTGQTSPQCWIGRAKKLGGASRSASAHTASVGESRRLGCERPNRRTRDDKRAMSVLSIVAQKSRSTIESVAWGGLSSLPFRKQ